MKKHFNFHIKYIHFTLRLVMGVGIQMNNKILLSIIFFLTFIIAIIFFGESNQRDKTIDDLEAKLELYEDEINQLKSEVFTYEEAEDEKIQLEEDLSKMESKYDFLTNAFKDLQKTLLFVKNPTIDEDRLSFDVFHLIDNGDTLSQASPETSRMIDDTPIYLLNEGDYLYEAPWEDLVDSDQDFLFEAFEDDVGNLIFMKELSLDPDFTIEEWEEDL